MLYEDLKKLKKRVISIEDYIKSNAKTRSIAPLRLAFEKLLSSDNADISYERTSEIFITKGTKRGERNLIYFPILDDYLVSHIIIRSNPKN